MGKAIKTIKDQVFISSKIGLKKLDGKNVIDGSSSYIKNTCESSFKRLKIDQLADNYKALTPSLIEQNLKDLDTLVSSIEVLGNRLPNGVRDLYLDF